LWYDYYRFFVVLAYLFLLGGILGARNDKSEIPTTRIDEKEARNEFA